MIQRRSLLTLPGLALAAGAAAQPANTTRIVVLFTAGGPVDAVARTLAQAPSTTSCLTTWRATSCRCRGW